MPVVIVTQADLDEGRFVLPGVLCDVCDCPSCPGRHPDWIIPPFVVDQPCEVLAFEGAAVHNHPDVNQCPDCLGHGVKLLTVQVPCGTFRPICNRIGPGFGKPDHRGCPDCDNGLVSVRLHVTAVLPIYDMRDERRPQLATYALVNRKGNISVMTKHGAATKRLYWPGGDPAGLVGKFLIKFTEVKE